MWPDKWVIYQALSLSVRCRCVPNFFCPSTRVVVYTAFAHGSNFPFWEDMCPLLRKKQSNLTHAMVDPATAGPSLSALPMGPCGRRHSSRTENSSRTECEGYRHWSQALLGNGVSSRETTRITSKLPVFIIKIKQPGFSIFLIMVSILYPGESCLWRQKEDNRNEWLNFSPLLELLLHLTIYGWSFLSTAHVC